MLRLNWVVRCRPAWIVALVLSAAAFLPDIARADLVNTSIYTSYSDNFPTGVQFSGTPTSNISTPDFQQFGFAAGNYMWYPQALTAFAADTVGYINVPTANSFTFSVSGAQDSYLFVDGVQTVFHGSDNVSSNQNTIPLSTGIHKIEVQYDIVKPQNQFPADIYSGWELGISPGNGFSIVAQPEPVSAGILAAGAVGLLLLKRRRFVSF